MFLGNYEWTDCQFGRQAPSQTGLSDNEWTGGNYLNIAGGLR